MIVKYSLVCCSGLRYRGIAVPQVSMAERTVSSAQIDARDVDSLYGLRAPERPRSWMIGHEVAAGTRDTDEARFLYGEVTREGMLRALRPDALDGDRALKIADLGSGLGKNAFRFFHMTKARHILCVELHDARFDKGVEAAQKFFERAPEMGWRADKWEAETKGQTVLSVKLHLSALPAKKTLLAPATTAKPQRIDRQQKRRLSRKTKSKALKGKSRSPPARRLMEFRRGNLFHSTDALDSDIVLVQTDFPVSMYATLCNFLQGMKRGSRLMSYLNVAALFSAHKLQCPFARLDLHSQPIDTTWQADSCLSIWLRL